MSVLGNWAPDNRAPDNWAPDNWAQLSGAQFATDSWAPDNRAPGPNLPLFQGGQLGSRQLGPEPIWYLQQYFWWLMDTFCNSRWHFHVGDGVYCIFDVIGVEYFAYWMVYLVFWTVNLIFWWTFYFFGWVSGDLDDILGILDGDFELGMIFWYLTYIFCVLPGVFGMLGNIFDI